MTIYDRPDEKVMAESALAGEVQDFPDILRGWGVAFDQTGGIPPMEWFNALAKRTDQAIRYFMQRGLPEWSASEDYPQGAYVQYAGESYLSKRANSNKQPSANANDWGRWSVTRDEFNARARANKKDFLASGQFIVPDMVFDIYVSGSAAGGGGGGSCGSAAAQVNWPATGGGGGCGESVLSRHFAVNPGDVIEIVIGGPGLGGPGGAVGLPGSNGTAGGNTTIGTLLTLRGGSPGTAGTQPNGTGGAGAGGSGFPCKGSPGSQGGGSGQGATGASSKLGGGGGGGQPIATSNIPLAAGGVGDIGGGGGGGGSTVVSNVGGGAGGNGGPGFALIEW